MENQGSPDLSGSSSRFVACPKCKTPLPTAPSVKAGFDVCSGCGSAIQAISFPALGRGLVPGNVGQAIVTEGEAGCFYHPQRRSVVACSACGRFLCALCDVELDGQHLCPACIETGQRKGKLVQLENRRILYDNMALAIAVIPLLIFMWPATIATAPAAVVCGILWWKKQSSIVPRTRIRLILAIVLGVLQIAGWAVGLVLLFRRA